ncbi:aminoacyl-histidine dipeptidase, partial [Erysipelatoclostridium ramosum]|nr:aminoacyl-histidine dipeptidase [Thomasclavelia ramosa]
NKLLARVLFTLNRRYGVQLSWMQGGIKDNAIPREASAAFVCQADLETVAACVQEMKTIFARELEFSDAGVDLAVKEIALDAV